MQWLLECKALLGVALQLGRRRRRRDQRQPRQRQLQHGGASHGAACCAGGAPISLVHSFASCQLLLLLLLCVWAMRAITELCNCDGARGPALDCCHFRGNSLLTSRCMLRLFRALLQTGAGGTDSLTAPGTATAVDRAGSAFTTPHAHAPHSPAGPSQGGGQPRLLLTSPAFCLPEADSRICNTTTRAQQEHACRMSYCLHKTPNLEAPSVSL